jgi:hypothetical protein
VVRHVEICTVKFCVSGLYLSTVVPVCISTLVVMVSFGPERVVIMTVYVIGGL